MSKLLVKNTNLINIRKGDLLMFQAAGILNGDFLGELIATFEGGEGRYTHVASVRDIPNPEAEVVEVQPGVFQVKENQTVEEIEVETQFEDYSKKGFLLHNDTGIKLEATFPKCREGAIDWANPWMEVWRIRDLTDQNIKDILKLQQDMVGIGPVNGHGEHDDAWDYNVAEFLTFGLLNQAAAKICSQFEADPVYVATLMRGCKNGNYAIPLTPDLKGNRDPQKTPNDIALSGSAYRIQFQGLRNQGGV